jgi:hypothetical protein
MNIAQIRHILCRSCRSSNQYIQRKNDSINDHHATPCCPTSLFGDALYLHSTFFLLIANPHNAESACIEDLDDLMRSL